MNKIISINEEKFIVKDRKYYNHSIFNQKADGKIMAVIKITFKVKKQHYAT